jgi:hypothetical protein
VIDEHGDLLVVRSYNDMKEIIARIIGEEE